MADPSPPVVAFVLPWYSSRAVGGAEVETQKLAQRVQEKGIAVEILTTCARDGATGWSRDYHKEGATVEDGLRIRRFRLNRRPLSRFADLNARLMRGQQLSREEERQFMAESVSSGQLCSFIAAHKESYVFVFIPYMVGTTYWGSRVAPERSFLIPCLHDEGYARMRLMLEMFWSVRKVLCLAGPELELARRLYGLDDWRLCLLGGGIDSDIAGNEDRFRARTGIREPFVLYVGRRDEAKNTPLLVDYFCRFKRASRGALKLVLAGPGAVAVPSSFTGEVIDLGFLSEQEKHDAYAAALVTCQPSVNESFSIVVMESWVQGTPVLVNANCAVTVDHCLRSNGGLFFRDYSEFEGCLHYLEENPRLGRKMGELGSRYVKANSAWERITARFVSAVFASQEDPPTRRLDETRGRHL